MNLPPSTSPIAGLPRAVPAAPGANVTAADEGPAFAQALDAAEARQREGQPDATDRGAAGPVPEAPGDGVEPRGPLRNAALRGPDPLQAAAAAVDTVTASLTSARIPVEGVVDEPAAPADAVPAPQDTTAPAELLPTDVLSAWISALALPPPVAQAAATSARDAGNDTKRTEEGLVPPLPPGHPSDAAASRVAQAGDESLKSRTPNPSTNALPPGLQAQGRTPGRWAMASELSGGSGQEPMPQSAQRAMAPLADGMGALPALTAVWTVAAPAATVAPVQQTEVQPPVGSREFAPALASQLSVMVRDGVEQAQLKLNPAELGPIEVRISIDGSQAQVDFSATHATTRQALQDAVPTLASTLRENGLTLTGGGVLEQPRDPRGEARQDTPRGQPVFGSEAHADHDALAAPVRPARARGILDLYA